MRRTSIHTSALALFLVVAGCSPRTDRAAIQSAARSPAATASVATDRVSHTLTAADSALRAHLKSLAPELHGETTHVFSPGRDSASARMKGAPVGEAAERFFAREYGNAMSQSADVFVVSWFALAPQHEVFLLRTPSQYDPSAMTLWAYDTAQQVWSRPLEIADAFGDAGWSFQKDAWIVRRGIEQDITVIIRRIDEDMDLESDNPVTQVGPDSLYSYSLQGWVNRSFFRQMLPTELRGRFQLRKSRDAAG